MDPAKTRVLAFTSVGHFINDGSTYFVPLIADLLAASKGFTPLEVASSLFVFYAVSTLASVEVGREADATGDIGKMLSVGVALLGVGLVGFYFAFVSSSGTLLLVISIGLCALMGYASAFYHPLGATMLQRWFGNAAGGRALGANGAIGSVGRALYPSLFFVIAVVLTQPESMGFLGVVALGAAATIWAGLRRFKISRAVERGRQRTRQVLTRSMIVLAVLTFARTASMFGVAAWIPEYLTFQRGLGVGTSLGFVLTAFFAAAIAGQPFFGYLLDKFDKRLIFLISSVGAALSILAYTNVGGLAGVVLLFSFGFFVYTGFPVLLSLAADYAPEGSAAMGNALIWGLGQTGGNAVGAAIIGAIVLNDYGRLDFAFQAMVGVAIASAFFILLLPKGGDTPRSTSPEWGAQGAPITMFFLGPRKRFVGWYQRNLRT